MEVNQVISCSEEHSQLMWLYTNLDYFETSDPNWSKLGTFVVYQHYYIKLTFSTLLTLFFEEVKITGSHLELSF